MYCDKCGYKLSSSESSCPNCGHKVVEEPRQVESASVRADEERSGPKIKTIITFVCIILIAISLILSRIDSNENSNAIKDVQTGYLTYYSQDITIKQAFENFFGSPAWNAGKADDDNYPEMDGMQLVNFTGTCVFDGDEVNMLIQFVVEENTDEFYLYAVEMDGEPLNDLEIEYLMTRVYLSD